MIKDISGQKFNRLTVIEFVGLNHRNESTWKCRCDCGNEIVIRREPLVTNHTKSCGCLRQEELKARKEHPHKVSHGLSHTRLYNIWCGMKARCNKPNSQASYRYYNRGIRVCDEWNNDFESFYGWSIKNGYKENLTIDRIDNNKGYYPDNCRWVDMLVQMNNTEKTTSVTYKNITDTLSNWCRKLNKNYSMVRWRLENGWSVNDAFEKPSARLKERIASAMEQVR